MLHMAWDWTTRLECQYLIFMLNILQYCMLQIDLWSFWEWKTSLTHVCLKSNNRNLRDLRKGTWCHMTLKHVWWRKNGQDYECAIWHLLCTVYTLMQDFPGGSDGKVSQCGRLGFDPWVGKIPWRRKWQPTPVLLPGKFHGQRSLVGYSPWGRKELDMTEQLHSLTCTALGYWLTSLWGTWSFAQFKLLLRRPTSHVHLGSSIIWPVKCKLELPVDKHCPTEDGGSRQSPSPLGAWCFL